MLALLLLATASGSPQVDVEGAALTIEPRTGEHALVIRSERTRLDIEQSKGWFEGGVVAERGDLRLTADRAEVDLSDGAQLRRAVAEGNVVVAQGENRASGQKAVIDGDRVVLTGSPVLETSQHRMVGDEMVFTVGAKTVECTACTVTVKAEESR